MMLPYRSKQRQARNSQEQPANICAQIRAANVTNGLHAALRSYCVKVKPMLANTEQSDDADDGDQNSSNDYHIYPQS
ncbi:hypothetical protein [Sphingorhabdus wooponensis]|uniref:Uncharacterized protein n=1 Tax=Sphingorhabdus wooponensis TaxID=940136 RepID=A0A3R8R805_9SPHN|nr:hypothetical protein [Sphingorhabdus wooponensis]RRQ52046.1 hypothetical protein D7D48_04015 [Sphingorhabdus wooponensis]